jgi:hypothetical protein
MKKVFKIISRILLLIFIVFIILIFVIPQFLSIFYGKDIKSIDDSIMNLQTINILEKENSFYDLEKINQLDNIDDVNINDLDINTFDKDVAIELLKKNKLALEYYDSAVRRDNFQSPYTSETKIISIDNIVPMNNWRRVSRLSILKTYLLAKQGKINQAFEESLKSIKLGSSIKNSQCDAITYFVGMALMNQGLDSINNIIKLYPEQSQIISKYINQLKEYDFDLNDSVVKVEYLTNKKLILSSNSKGPNYQREKDNFIIKYFMKNKFYYKPNTTFKYLVDFYTEVMNKPKEACVDVKRVEFEDDPYLLLKDDSNRLSILLKAYFSENFMGKIIMSAVLYDPTATSKRCEYQTKLNEIINKY